MPTIHHLTVSRRPGTLNSVIPEVGAISGDDDLPSTRSSEDTAMTLIKLGNVLSQTRSTNSIGGTDDVSFRL
jgi:hypothetical protein